MFVFYSFICLFAYFLPSMLRMNEWKSIFCSNLIFILRNWKQSVLVSIIVFLPHLLHDKPQRNETSRLTFAIFECFFVSSLWIENVANLFGTRYQSNSFCETIHWESVKWEDSRTNCAAEKDLFAFRTLVVSQHIFH